MSNKVREEEHCVYYYSYEAHFCLFPYFDHSYGQHRIFIVHKRDECCGGSNYWTSNDSIKVLNTIIDNTISPKIHDIEMLSNQASKNLYEGHESPEIRNQLAQYAALHPEILSIYVGTQEGFFIQEPVINDTSTYDPRTRDWYKQSMEQKGEILVSSPYKDAAVDNMVVTISKTTKDHSGVISVDITLDYITKLTNQVTIGNEGYAFLLDENMHFISHPSGEGGAKGTR